MKSLELRHSREKIERCLLDGKRAHCFLFDCIFINYNHEYKPLIIQIKLAENHTYLFYLVRLQPKKMELK